MSNIHKSSYKALILEELEARVGTIRGFFEDKEGHHSFGFITGLTYNKAGYLQIGENVDFCPIDEDGIEITHLDGISL